MNFQPKQLFGAIGFGWTLLVLLLMLYCDFEMPALMQNSDFLSCIYSGAKLFALGRFSEIYAPYNATGFAHQPCDIAAHQFLPGFNPNLVAEFNYSPVVAWLLSPLSYLSPHLAMFAWQLLSIGAVVLAIWFLVPKKSRASALRSSMIFLPLPIALWIGQLDLVFGVLFFSWGYYLARNNKLFLSGLVFSFACLKPQFIVVPGLLALVYLAKKEWQFAVGLAAGLIAVMASNLMVGSVELFQQWLANVKLCEKIFTAADNGLAEHLLVSLPGLMFRFFPPEHFALMKPIVYLSGATLGLWTAWVCVQFRKAHGDSNAWLIYTYVSGLLLMPFVVPAMLFYDLSLFLTIAFVCLDRDAISSLRFPVGQFILAGATAINVYAIILLSAKSLAFPTLIVAALVTMYAIWILLNSRISIVSRATAKSIEPAS